ncbi:hypothetical protein AAC387_Pa11g0261 [Persea americana]
MGGEAVLSIVLKGLLSKLSSPILDEFGLLWGVKKEKQKLESNLERIIAVLQDGERQQIVLMNEKDRLRKLKDVAYDAEDLVDEFLVEALRRKVENQDGMGRKVGKFFSPSNPLAFHCKIAHKMKELRERFDELTKENNNFQLPEGVARSQPQISNPRETASSVPDSGVHGRDYEKGNLIDSLISNSGKEEVLSVIPIVGMGGLGKTTLAQFVYDDERLVTHFKLKMWVYVSEDFNVGRILAKILQSATKKSTATDGSSKDLLITRVKENLSGNRYLLVLDDVWNEVYEKWVELRTVLKCGAIGSKILVTTRSDTVARIMHALPRPRLDILSAAESWTLFEEVAHPPTDFVSIGKEIVRKCGGVPLAITTVGGMLLDKTGEREWQSVRDSELWTRTDEEGRVLSILRLSYDHLTSSLKPCFAYCAVIPKGRQFNKDELIKEWIAQGFIHSKDENELLEEEGEKYFNSLLRRTLPKFIIAKESGARIEELKGLNLLWGNIHIGGLDNIGSVGCAGEADLKAKKHLNSLKLSWSSDQTVAAEGNAKEVIEVLEPHSNLKELSVKNYTGLEFPSWMMKKLTKLKKISLWSCNRCEHLPPLGQLPFLESLEICIMDAVEFGLCHFKFNKELQV